MVFPLSHDGHDGHISGETVENVPSEILGKWGQCHTSDPEKVPSGERRLASSVPFRKLGV